MLYGHFARICFGRKEGIIMDDEFDFAAYEKALKDDPMYPVNDCIALIETVMDDSIIRLYMSIDNYLFQDIHFDKVISNMPKWVCDEGISPEGGCTKDFYEQLRKKATHPIFGRFIYYYDLWSLLAAVQDRLSAVIMFMRDFYKEVTCKVEHKQDEYTAGSRHGGERETYAHVMLNSIFVAYASVFDLMAKIAREQYMFGSYDFEKYKEMKSNGTLFSYTMKNISSTLKAPNMIFSAPLVVRKIVNFRNEYVHNGPWDLRSSIYSTAIDGEPADVIMYAPDMDEFGNFVKSGSRNKFYSQNNAINAQLPSMIKEATELLKNTIDELCRLYQADTNVKEDPEKTEDCLKGIREFYDTLIHNGHKE